MPATREDAVEDRTVSTAIPAVNFGAESAFAVGIEEELLLVDPVTHALDHSAVDVLGRMAVQPDDGAALPEAFAALVELTSPVCSETERPSRRSPACGASSGRPAPRRSGPACIRMERSETWSTTRA